MRNTRNHPIILTEHTINHNSLYSVSLVTCCNFQTSSTNSGVYLTDSARRLFIRKVEERLTEDVSHPNATTPIAYRRAIQLQIKHYKTCLTETMAYQPFLRAS